MSLSALPFLSTSNPTFKASEFQELWTFYMVVCIIAGPRGVDCLRWLSKSRDSKGADGCAILGLPI